MPHAPRDGEPLRIGLVYDLREDYLAMGWDEQAVAEFDRTDTIDALEAAVASRGHAVERVGNADALLTRLTRGARWDLVFNIAESVAGVGRESLVPAVLDHYGIASTFADPLVCAATLDKPTAKRLLRDMGLPTPDFRVIETAADARAATQDMPMPVFVKPVREGSSKGVGPESLVRDPSRLERVCLALVERFGQAALVEAYLPGREVTVGLVGTGDAAEVVGVLDVRIRPEASDAVYTYQTKEQCEQLVEYRLDTSAGGAAAAELALRAYRAMGCRDAGRVDLRQDRQGEWSIMELNPRPGLHPHHSDLPIVAGLAGWSYERLIGRIVESARRRIDETRAAARRPDTLLHSSSALG